MSQEAIQTVQPFDLIISIANNGHAEDVMTAAKAAGARGGTILHAKGQGSKDAEHFFNILIEPEKEVLLIVVPHDIKNKVMQAICEQAGLRTASRAVTFSVPVESVTGLSSLVDQPLPDAE